MARSPGRLLRDFSPGVCCPRQVLSNAADRLGLKTTGITKGPFGVGCLLKMSSGHQDYEVLVDSAGVLLGRVGKSGQRVRLCTGTNTETQWNTLLQTLRNSEGRML
jgi:hypothetical protein